MDHVRKGCLTRTRNGVKADGSRIECSHVGWNGLQRGHTLGIITMNALGHDHILRWNVARMSSAPEPSTFIKSCFGSSHIGLVDSNARTWNHLLEGTASLDHHRLPCLEPYPMRETFGVVESQHALSTLPVAVKSEEIDTLAEGDHEQLGLHPHLLESETIKHDMLDDPTMHLKADMFVQLLTCTPSLPQPSPLPCHYSWTHSPVQNVRFLNLCHCLLLLHPYPCTNSLVWSVKFHSCRSQQ